MTLYNGYEEPYVEHEEHQEYLEGYTVINGALADEEIFYDFIMFDDWARDEVEYARRDGYEVQVYVIPHNHSLDFEGDCDCSSYLTDHHPYMKYDPHNPDDNKEDET